MNLDLVAIDLRIELLDFPRDLCGSFAECVEREADDSLASSAHCKDVGFELPKLDFEVPAAVRRC